MLWSNGLDFLGIKDEEQFYPEDRKKKLEDIIQKEDTNLDTLQSSSQLVREKPQPVQHEVSQTLIGARV